MFSCGSAFFKNLPQVPQEFNPVSLFAENEPGVWCDPLNSSVSNLSKVFTGGVAVAASGDPIGAMADITNRGKNFIQAANEKRPTYLIDGQLRGVRFDGVSQSMYVADATFAGSAKVTMVIAVRQRSSVGAGVVLEAGAAYDDVGGGFGAYVNNGSNSGQIGGGMGLGNSAYIFNNAPGGSVPRAYVATMIFDPSAGTQAGKMRIRINGSEIDESVIASAGTVTSSAFRAHALFLGSRANNSLYSQIDFFGGGIIGRELTAEEIYNAEAWAAVRAGVMLIPAPMVVSGFSDTGAELPKSGYLLTSPFAHADYQTTATSVTINSLNTIYSLFPQYTEIGVYVNGVFSRRVVPTALGASSATITLPAGDKLVSFVNGLQSRPDPASDPIGTFLASLSANAVMTRVTPAPTNRVLVYGDSIAVGGNADIAVSQAWPMLVRSAYAPGSLSLEAWGYRSLHEDCADSAARAAFVAKLVAYSPSRFWLAIGTNDYGLNKWSSGAFGDAYAALLDDIHAALPSVAIFAQTPIVRSGEAANGSGNTMGQYRAQIATAAAARSGYVTLVDGAAILTTAQLDDGVHPSTAGHVIYANVVKTALGI